MFSARKNVFRDFWNSENFVRCVRGILSGLSEKFYTFIKIVPIRARFLCQIGHKFVNFMCDKFVTKIVPFFGTIFVPYVAQFFLCVILAFGQKIVP